MGDLYLVGVDHGDLGYDRTTKAVWRVNPDGSFTLVNMSSAPAKPSPTGRRPPDSLHVTNEPPSDFQPKDE